MTVLVVVVEVIVVVVLWTDVTVEVDVLVAMPSHDEQNGVEDGKAVMIRITGASGAHVPDRTGPART